MRVAEAAEGSEEGEGTQVHGKRNKPETERPRFGGGSQTLVKEWWIHRHTDESSTRDRAKEDSRPACLPHLSLFFPIPGGSPQEPGTGSGTGNIS